MTLSVIRKQQNAKETYKMALSQSSTNPKTKKKSAWNDGERLANLRPRNRTTREGPLAEIASL